MPDEKTDLASLATDTTLPLETPETLATVPLPAPGAFRPTRFSLPPDQKWIRVVTHTMIDLTAILGLVALVLWGGLDATVASTIIAIIAGAWVTGQLRGNGTGTGTGSGTGSAVSLLATFAGAVWQILKTKVG